MTKLTPLEIYEVARQAGFSSHDAVTWTAIALAESGGNTEAHATHGEDSRGLWQINVRPGVRSNTWGDLYDPLTNARAAFEVSHSGRTMQPWTTTHTSVLGTARDYHRYLGEAESAASHAGSGSPHSGSAETTFVLDAHGSSQEVTLDMSSDSSTHDVRPLSDAKLVDTFGAPRPGGRTHQGIDIFADRGTPIHAVASGTIVKGFQNDLGGVVVRIQGDDGRFYYYAHLKEGSVDGLHVGQHVSVGDVIGQVGNTGDASTTSPHLHFQVEENGHWLDPYNFLSPLPDPDTLTAADTGTGTGTGSTVDNTDPYAIDSGSHAGDVDSDHDGLTDQFEQMYHTDPHLADSDHDGLTDSFELMISHTDPLSADSNADGIPDGVEYTTGGTSGHSALLTATGLSGASGLTSTTGTGQSTLPSLNALPADGTDPTDGHTDVIGGSDGLGGSSDSTAGSIPTMAAAPVEDDLHGAGLDHTDHLDGSTHN